MLNNNHFKLLKESDYHDFDYENDEYFDYDYQDCFDYGDFIRIDYTTDKNGLVDWSDEIPLSVKRNKKIEQLFSKEDFINNISLFWPKNGK